MKRMQGLRIYDWIIYLVLFIVGLMSFLPFLYILSGSVVSEKELLTHAFVLIPTQISWDAYRYIFSSNIILHSLLISIFITLVGTAINLVLTAVMAYPLAKTRLMGRKFFMLMVVFTMLFGGGMIPTYLVVKEFGLLNTYFSLWLPSAISAFNLILLKNFFQQLPEEIEESAKLDGYNDLQILWKIVIPLSLPAMATFTLFYAVANWNSWFTAVLYLNNLEMWPIQVWLRQIVILAAGGFTNASAQGEVTTIPPDSIKLAV
ncbi:MAG: YtcP3, partial [Bacilli bacterium]|nr:YtcP3 [Bacilli bacterium]